MQHIISTPFGRRPAVFGHLAAQSLAEGATSHAPDMPKWQALRDLGLARKHFGISDRDLVVLSALLSFWRPDTIPASQAIVFPSNAALSQRAHGMAESTLRRHLATLVTAGLIRRQDSPNGKRYMRRGHGGAADRAFGFDLAPLAQRAEEIRDTARAAAQAEEETRRLREAVVLRLRDTARLIAWAEAQRPGAWEHLSEALATIRRSLRRRMDPATLKQMDAALTTLLSHIDRLMPLTESEDSSGSDSRNERHIQVSDRMNSESEHAVEKTGGEVEIADEPPTIPLPLVLQACPDILPYAAGRIACWQDLIAAARFLHAMLGITAETWEEACRKMGPISAAITLACMLQSFDRIANPGGYLRALSRKAAAGTYSTGPMVMALLTAENRMMS